MRAGGVNLILLIVLLVVPNLALPVKSVCRRIIVKALPPNGIVIKIVANVGEDAVTHSGMKSVGVGMLVSTGSNAEEAVLGVLPAVTQHSNFSRSSSKLVLFLSF